MATGVGESISALELIKITKSVKDGIEQIYRADEEVKQFNKKLTDLDSFMKSVSARSQEPDFVRLNAAISSLVSDMNQDVVVFQNEMSHFPHLSKDDSSRKRALRERLRWLWKSRRTAAQLSQQLEQKRQFLEVEVVVQSGVQDMAHISEAQVAVILGKIAKFETTFKGNVEQSGETQKGKIRKSKRVGKANKMASKSVQNMFGRIRLEINPQFTDARSLTKEAEPLSLTSLGDESGSDEKITMLGQILEKAAMGIERKDSSNELNSVSPAAIDTAQCADIVLQEQEDTDDDADEQYDAASVTSDPGWTDDIFTDETTNAMLLHTWREEVMKRLPGEIEERKREEERQSILLIWLREWPEDVMNVFTERIPFSPRQQPQQNGPVDGKNLWNILIAVTVSSAVGSALGASAPVTLPLIGVYTIFQMGNELINW